MERSGVSGEGGKVASYEKIEMNGRSAPVMEAGPAQGMAWVRDGSDYGYQEKDLELWWRMVGIFVWLLALLLLVSGAGGVKGQRCRQLRVRGRQVNQSELSKNPYMMDCDELDPIVLVQGYFAIDSLLGTPGPSDGRGLPSLEALVKAEAGRKSTRAWLRVPVGLDTVVFVNSVGLKVALVFGMAGLALAVWLWMVSAGIVWYYSPKLVLKERLCIGFCAGSGLLSGTLALVWGYFAHLSREEMGEMRALMCPGWVSGGACLLVAACWSLADLGAPALLGAERWNGNRQTQARPTSQMQGQNHTSFGPSRQRLMDAKLSRRSSALDATAKMDATSGPGDKPPPMTTTTSLASGRRRESKTLASKANNSANSNSKRGRSVHTAASLGPASRQLRSLGPSKAKSTTTASKGSQAPRVSRASSRRR